MPAPCEPEPEWVTVLDTHFGPLRVAGMTTGLTFVGFTEADQLPRRERDRQGDTRLLMEATQQLREYFEGRRQHFTLPVAPAGTPFQQRVWRELQKIPWGTTTTYRDIAQRIGRPTAVRAVGSANGRNPVAIVIPCHRVIGSDGSLTGYAGGIATKRRLLQHEGALLM